MIPRQAVWTAVMAFTVHLGCGQEFRQTVRECDNSPGATGYSSISDMNTDIEREIEAIAGGKTPDTSYLFVLCPDTQLDVGDTPLTPMLDNSIFACGDTGKSTGCVIKGGEIQVNVPRSKEGGHQMQSVSFMGVSFRGFSHAAISGDAGSTTEVTLSHVKFSDYNAMCAVQQQTKDGTEPFGLMGQDVSISKAVGGVAFSNVGGALSLNGLYISGCDFVGGVSTGSSLGGSIGVTMVKKAVITTSSIQDVFSTIEASRMNAVNVKVSNMKSMTNVFSVEGNSMATLENIIVANNDFKRASPSLLWIGVDVRDNSMASVAGFIVRESTNVRHFVAAHSKSMVNVQNSAANDLIGGRESDTNEISALFFASESSDLIIERTDTTNTVLFTAIAFANKASSIQYRESCVGTGDAQAAIFIDANSTYVTAMNFIDPSFSTSDCIEGNSRIFKEKPNQTCFQSPFVSCEASCEQGFDRRTCLRAIVARQVGNETETSPTIPVNVTSPTIPVNVTAPTAAPSLIVVSAAPSSATTTAPSAPGSPEPTAAVTPPPVVASTSAPTAAPVVTATGTPTAAPVVTATGTPTAAPVITTTSTPTAAPIITTTTSPTAAPVITTTATPTASPTAAPIIRRTPQPSAAPLPRPTRAPTTPSPTQKETAHPTIFPTQSSSKVCTEWGKWVKREHQTKGKGLHVFYAFDENICVNYESLSTDEFFGGTIAIHGLQKDYDSWPSSSSGKGKSPGKKSGKKSKKSYSKKSSKHGDYGRSDDYRKRKRPTSIWIKHDG